MCGLQYPDCAAPEYIENFTIPLQKKQLSDIAKSGVPTAVRTPNTNNSLTRSYSMLNSLLCSCLCCVAWERYRQAMVASTSHAVRPQHSFSTSWTQHHELMIGATVQTSDRTSMRTIARPTRSPCRASHKRPVSRHSLCSAGFWCHCET